jgi:Na+-driven multidrug efflux pump
MMVCLEWWLFEIANMLSGTLPDPETALAVTGVCAQLVGLAFMVPLGIAAGLRIRVANLMGVLLSQPSAFCK